MRLWGGARVANDADLPENLSSRLKSILAQLLDPEAGFAGAVIAHGGAEDVQLFGVLRELGRTGRGPGFPVHFIDLLQGPDAPVTAYNHARLTGLRAWLEALAGHPVDDAAIAAAVAAENQRRQAVARLFERRRQTPPKLSGAEAMALVRKLEVSPGDAADALIARTEDSDPTPLLGPRLLITGSPHESADLYALIEAAGAVIVGEDHDGGDVWAAYQVEENLPPIQALAVRPQRLPGGPTARTADRVEALSRRVADLRPDGVIHLRIGGDEAAPWDLKATRDALDKLGTALLALSSETSPAPEAAAALQQRIAAFLRADREAAAGPRPHPVKTPQASGPSKDSGRRSRKSLACTRDFSASQRAWFAEVRKQAANGPFAVVNADAPQELLRAMGIPYVVNQWWASIVAAKQKSSDYAGHLRAAGYPANVEAYSAQGLAAALADDDADPPWGGLPRPDLLALVAGSDAGPKLFEAWAAETGATLQMFERSVECRWDPPVAWWDDMPVRWSTALEPERLDLLTAQLESEVARLEALTGRPFDRARLVEVMRLVNEQEEDYRRTRDLIAAARPAPIGIADSMPATMTPQWRRGSQWGRDAARRFHEEVRERVEQGVAACPGERLRLMWVGRGLWSDMGFYQRWEDSHGAVFVWSMYLGLAADGYIRAFEGEHDVMRALAARFLTMGDELRMPTWAGAWHVKEALTHGVHGAVAIDDADPLVLEALQRAGVPVCRVEMDNMTANAAVAEDQITTFIESLTSDQANTLREQAL